MVHIFHNLVLLEPGSIMPQRYSSAPYLESRLPSAMDSLVRGTKEETK